MLRRQVLTERLVRSLQIRSTKATELLGWRPPLTVDEGLRRAVQPRTD
jgi:hypothetical protein